MCCVVPSAPLSNNTKGTEWERGEIKNVHGSLGVVAVHGDLKNKLIVKLFLYGRLNFYFHCYFLNQRVTPFSPLMDRPMVAVDPTVKKVIFNWSMRQVVNENKQKSYDHIIHILKMPTEFFFFFIGFWARPKGDDDSRLWTIVEDYFFRTIHPSSMNGTCCINDCGRLFCQQSKCQDSLNNQMEYKKIRADFITHVFLYCFPLIAVRLYVMYRCARIVLLIRSVTSHNWFMATDKWMSIRMFFFVPR